MSTYVISDIHAHYELFEAMLQLIQFSEQDHLYVLGDIVDKGPAPIPLIQKIMSMKNVTFLLGNHEKMLLDAIEENDYILWYNNGGYYTESEIDKLDEVQYNSLMHFLKRAPLYKEIEVNDHKFFLSHAQYTDIHANDISEKAVNDILLWGRHVVLPPDDTIAISGHTPTNHRTFDDGIQLPKIYHEKNYIDIDCGCAGLVFGLPGQLCCLRLEDMQTFYVEPSKEYLTQFQI